MSATQTTITRTVIGRIQLFSHFVNIFLAFLLVIFGPSQHFCALCTINSVFRAFLQSAGEGPSEDISRDNRPKKSVAQLFIISNFLDAPQKKANNKETFKEHPTAFVSRCAPPRVHLSGVHRPLH